MSVKLWSKASTVLHYDDLLPGGHQNSHASVAACERKGAGQRNGECNLNLALPESSEVGDGSLWSYGAGKIF